MYVCIYLHIYIYKCLYIYINIWSACHTYIIHEEENARHDDSLDCYRVYDSVTKKKRTLEKESGRPFFMSQSMTAEFCIM